MANERNYQSGVEKALFVLSRGFCYAPTCKNPVVTLDENGEPCVSVYIAHIRAAKRNGKRWDENMTPLERKSFANLLLLCKRHHDKVDGNDTWKDFPADLLTEWKKQREKSLADQIVGLERLTEDDLERKLTESTAHLRSDILEGIDKIAEISDDVRGVLKALVDEPFTRRLVDPDALAALEHSAKALAFIQDYAPILRDSAQALVFVQDYAPMLRESADAIAALQDHASTLQDASRALVFVHDHSTTLTRFSNAVDELGVYMGPIQELVGIKHDLQTLAASSRGFSGLDPEDLADAADKATRAAGELRAARNAFAALQSVTDFVDLEIKLKAKLICIGAAIGVVLVLVIQILGVTVWT